METRRRPSATHGRVALMTGRGAVAASVLMIVAGGVPASAGSASFVYPTDCPTKVQDCIDLAGPGDTVVVAADGLIDESVEVGNKGMTGAPRFLLGSVPNKVSHHSPCSVIIAKTT